MNTMSDTTPRQAPVWRLGFRPFFILAALIGVAAVLRWTSLLLGEGAPGGHWDPLLWHAHEMVFGYTTAVIAGFILTASQNWTGMRGLHGARLQFLVALWLAARLLLWVVPQPSVWVAIIDLAFYPCLALNMVPYFKPPEMKMERVFFLFFAFYFVGNLAMHFEALRWVVGFGMRGAWLGVHTSILMIVLIGGRVLPFFAASERARAQPRTVLFLERASHVSAGAFLVSQLVFPFHRVTAVGAFLAAAIHFLRLRGWYVRRVRRVALLGVLFGAYLWIVVGFFLFGWVSLQVIPLGPAMHALTMGGVGVMSLGMTTRVALGHTGRRLKPARSIMWAYGLLNAAVATRVFGQLLFAQEVRGWVTLTAILWVLALSIFLWVYVPVLTSARVDGRDG